MTGPHLTSEERAAIRHKALVEAKRHPHRKSHVGQKHSGHGHGDHAKGAYRSAMPNRPQDDGSPQPYADMLMALKNPAPDDSIKDASSPPTLTSQETPWKAKVILAPPIPVESVPVSQASAPSDPIKAVADAVEARVKPIMRALNPF